MSISVEWQSDLHFKVATKEGFEFSVDANNKQAACPTQILLAALASCCATDVVMGLLDAAVELKKLNNYVTYELTDSEPRLYKSVNLHFVIEADNIFESQAETIIEDAINKYCNVCLMLQPAMAITYTTEVVR